MRRNATRNISAPTGKTAVIKMPSPSANAHSPTQRHGPDGGRGGGFGTMLLPLSRRSPAPFYTKARNVFPLYHGKAPNFYVGLCAILDNFPAPYSIRIT